MGNRGGMHDDSWMSYLQPFPFAKIKIDRSFVNDIAENVGSIKSLAAIAALAQELRIQATTEGANNCWRRSKPKAQ